MKKIFLLSIIFIICLVSRGWSIDAQSFQAQFKQAGDLYLQGNYKEAVGAYEDILAQGYTSGALYYNLGNAYYKEGQLGKAVVNYERAKMLIPRDRDLKANDQYLQTLIKNTVEESQESFIERVKQKLIGKMTEGEMAACALVFYILAAMTVLTLRFFNPYKTVSLSFLILFACLWAGQLAVLQARNEYYKTQAIILVKTESKYEPSDDSTTYYHLHEGMTVKVLDEREKWVKIIRGDSKAGWVKAETLEKLSTGGNAHL